MIRNYLKTAIRSLFRHRFFSAINVFGLAVSMSICMAIIMLVADQLTYDRYNTRRDRIYRITSTPIGSDGAKFNETATTTLPISQELLDNYTVAEKTVRIVRGFANYWIEIEQDVNVPVSGYFADPEILDVLEYDLEYGDPKTALVDPFSVVLTKRAAKKLFREDNPVGQTLRVGQTGVYKVTGVIRDDKRKSHIVFEALASMATVKSLEASGKRNKDLDNWYNYTQGWVYVMLQKGKTRDDMASVFKNIEKKHFSTVPNPETQQKISYSLQGLMEITPGPLINNPIGPFMPWIFIYFFAGIAAVVMLTSCFNFTNLSIARSLTRAREIGVRKVTGAARWQIFIQFISESVLVSMLALCISLIFLIALKPLVLKLSFAQIMRWDLELNYYVFGVFVLFAILVGVVAGLFPAVVLSGFQPAKVLKNIGSIKLFSRMGLRRALLVTQFTFSLIFILTVLVVFNQLNLFLKADHGFAMDHKIVVTLNHTSAGTLKNELLKHGNIKTVTAASHVPAAGSSKGMSFKNSLVDKDWTMLYYYATDEDYLNNMKIHMVAGKFYTPETSNKNFIVISEKAASILHFNSPASAVGENIILQSDSSRKKIIGVVQNYNHQMLMEEMKPLALVYEQTEFDILQVEYSGPYSDAVNSVEASWTKVNPSLKLDYKDFSEEIHKMYNILFGDLGDILSVVSFLAIVISCLGLLGMATYSTETRKKEISIRKVLGSDNGSLVYLLSKGFFVILLLSILIAVPAAYFLNMLWLEQMAYHVTVDVPVIVTGVVLLIVFGTITIGSQTWRATFVNPVDNLKGE